MKNHANERKVTQISMPEAGCGLDRLEWHKVEHFIKEMCAQSNLTITFYEQSKNEQSQKQEEVPVRSAPGQEQRQDEALSKFFEWTQKGQLPRHKNYKEFLDSPGNSTTNSSVCSSSMEICAENSKPETMKWCYNK